MILCRNQGHLPTFGPALLHLYGSTRDYWFVENKYDDEDDDNDDDGDGDDDNDDDDDDA